MDDYQNQSNPLNEVDGMPQQPSYPSQNFSGTNYGASGSYSYGYDPNMQNNDAGKVCAIVSLVCGIIGLIACCFSGGIAIIVSIAAVVLAAVSKKQKGSFSGLAIAGLVCGIIGVIFNVITLILLVIGIGSMDLLNDPDFVNSVLEMT